MNRLLDLIALALMIAATAAIMWLFLLAAAS